jgi:hypothetical protein
MAALLIDGYRSDNQGTRPGFRARASGQNLAVDFAYDSRGDANAVFDMQGRKSRHRQILYRVRHTFCVKVPIMRSREPTASKVLRPMLESNRNTTGGCAGRAPA